MDQSYINEQQNFLKGKLKLYKSLNQLQQQRNVVYDKLIPRSSLQVRKQLSNNQLDDLFTIRKRSSILEDKYLTQQKWEQRERDSKRLDKGKVQKFDQIDRLSIIVVFLILFFLALKVAPNQFYTPEGK